MNADRQCSLATPGQSAPGSHSQHYPLWRLRLLQLLLFFIFLEVLSPPTASAASGGSQSRNRPAAGGPGSCTKPRAPLPPPTVWDADRSNSPGAKASFVVKLSLARVTVVGLATSGPAAVLQWSASFVLAWNETERRERRRRRRRWHLDKGIVENDDDGLTSGVEGDDIWNRHGAPVGGESRGPNGEAALQFRAALRTRCRVPPNSPRFPFDTRSCDLRLRRRRRRRLLLLSNASLSLGPDWTPAAGVYGWCLTRATVLSPASAYEGAGKLQTDAADSCFRLELARALAVYYCLLVGLPLATLAVAAAATRAACGRERRQRCLDFGCVLLGCCLLLIGQALCYYAKNAAS